MTLFDTAGMERFTGTVPPTYFRHAGVVILVYSIDNAESIGNILKTWADNFSPNRLGESSYSMTRVLVGNKSDLEEERDVSRDRAVETAHLCEVLPDMVFEVSALTGDGFEELFTKVAQILDSVQQPTMNSDVKCKLGNPPGAKKAKPSCSGCSK